MQPTGKMDALIEMQIDPLVKQILVAAAKWREMDRAKQTPPNRAMAIHDEEEILRHAIDMVEWNT